MADGSLRKAERRRWQDVIIDHLKEFPRQYAALENAISAFGDDFDLPEFKAAFETAEDMEAYNRVQAVERARSNSPSFRGQLSATTVPGLSRHSKHYVKLA